MKLPVDLSPNAPVRLFTLLVGEEDLEKIVRDCADTCISLRVKDLVGYTIQGNEATDVCRAAILKRYGLK